MKTMIALAVLVMFVSCTRTTTPSQLDGTWTGVDWGKVTLDGLNGTYSDTYGKTPGQIHLTAQTNGTYSGTWSEGTVRFGTLELRFEGADVITGKWTADPKCEKKARDGGDIKWTRIK
jgi:hypothetical protein